MIKIEQKQPYENSDYKLRLCLSPFCFNSANRLFSLQNLKSYIHDKQQCSKWVVCLKQLLHPITSFKLKQLSNVQLDFNIDPVLTLRNILRLEKSDWKKQLSKELNTIKKEINSALETMQTNIQKKVIEILQKGKIYTDLNSLIEKSLILSSEHNDNDKNPVIKPNDKNEHFAIELTDQINKYFFQNGKTISEMKSIHFLKKFEMKDEVAEIKNKIIQLQKKLIEQKNIFNVRSNERVQFYEWIFQKDENMFNRLQVIGSSFNGKQQSYHVQGQTIRLNCMICQKYVLEKVTPIHMKQLKKFVAQQLVIHMYNQHHDKIFYSYLRNMVKTQFSSLSIKEVFQKIQKCEQFHVIDRQTGVSYTQDFISTQIQSIDILTKKNIHLAKNNYLLIQSKQAINSIVSILAYYCWINKKKILIVSTRFDHLTEGSSLIGLDNIQVTRKFDGSQSIKTEQKKAKIDPFLIKKNTSK